MENKIILKLPKIKKSGDFVMNEIPQALEPFLSYYDFLPCDIYINGKKIRITEEGFFDNY